MREKPQLFQFKGNDEHEARMGLVKRKIMTTIVQKEVVISFKVQTDCDFVFQLSLSNLQFVLIVARRLRLSIHALARSIFHCLVRWSNSRNWRKHS